LVGGFMPLEYYLQILLEAIKWGFNIDNSNAVSTISKNIPLLENVYQNLGLFITASISIIDFLYAIYRKNFFHFY